MWVVTKRNRDINGRKINQQCHRKKEGEKLKTVCVERRKNSAREGEGKRDTD